MSNLQTIFFYSFSCSSLLVYGIGLEKTFFESRFISRFLLSLPSIILDALVSVAILWFFETRILLRFNLNYLIPMTGVFVCGLVHLLLSYILPVFYKKQRTEKFFFLGIVFLALFEAISFVDSIMIVIASIISLIFSTIFLFSVRKRIEDSHIHPDWKDPPLVLVSIGLLCLVLYSPDVSWWLTEVVL